MDIGQGFFIFLQIWYESPHTGEDGQPHREATLAETQPMHGASAQDIAVRNAI